MVLPNKVVEVVISFIGHLGWLSAGRCCLRPWRIHEIPGQVYKLRRGGSLTIAVSGEHRRKGTPNKYKVESEQLIILNAKALFCFWQLFLFVIYMCIV